VPLTRHLLRLLKLTVLAGVSIICASVLYILVLLVASPTFRANALELIGLDSVTKYFAESRFGGSERSLPPDLQDLFTIRQDHSAISSWILGCIGADTGGSIAWPVRAQFILPSEQLRVLPDLSAKWPSDISHLTNKEKALIELSRLLSEQRLVLSAKVRSTYLFWEATTLVSICIGMITTILVSVSSTEFGRGDGYYQRLIRILAIIFPVLGTAAAAVIGFYGPQAAWGLASRTLASETQLHDQMAIGVWELTCPKSDTDATAGPLTASLKEWSKRYIDIDTISNASGTPSAVQGGGNPPVGNPSGSPASSQKPP
jgi:hypothetical protein